MKKENYQLFEHYMCSCMEDSAHDKEHVYRVLYEALEIASYEENVDYDVLICACLLHDIGRKEQFADSSLCHAQVGSEKAYNFLVKSGFSIDFADRVAHCILCHRYRNSNIPQTIEAKILFDADKLDVSGAIGIARTLLYNGQVSEPLYSLDSNGFVSNGENDMLPSFLQEYHYKLERLYDKFFTAHGAEVARQRQQAAITFYENILLEVSSPYRQGKERLNQIVEK